MMGEEYNQPQIVRSPWIAASTTFAAFITCGLVPLLPYLFSLPNSFLYSFLLTGLVFFGIGTVKSKWSLQSWWLAGLTTLFIGIAAAILAFAIGFLLRSYLS